MKKLLWVLTILGSILGAAIVPIGISASKGAPQEAVFIALGIAFAVIPYCLARAYSELRTKEA